jgi:cytochrome P450
VASSIELIEAIRARIATEGRVLPTPNGQLGVFDPTIIAPVNAENYRDLHMPETLGDLLLFRNREPVRWDEVRAAFMSRIRLQSTPPVLTQLYQRMRDYLAAQAGEGLDLTWTTECAISRPLIPMIIDGLTPRDARQILHDQTTKLADLLKPGVGGDSLRYRFQKIKAGTQGGFAVARTLKRRLKGKAPPQDDMAQTLMPLMGRLGVTRAAYAVTTLLTAIAGAPGSVAACLLFELKAHPDWEQRLREELSGLAVADLCSGAIRKAPVTYRFIREVFRLWSFPLVAGREAMKELSIAGHPMMPGQTYMLSSYITHRDPGYWRDPEAFDPDRWLEPEPDSSGGAFVPFGWAPRACIGAAIGLAQFFLFCRLVTLDFDVTLPEGSRAAIELEGIAVPRNFIGSVTPRPA